MNRIFKPVAILCAIALVGGSLPAHSQSEPAPPEGGRHGRFGPGPQMMERLAEKLDLTDAQRVQFKGIIARYHVGPLGDNMKALHQATMQLESLVRDPSANEQQVQEAARLVSTQAEQAALQRHRMAIEIDSILTDDQRQKAKDFRAQELTKPEHFRHPHGGFTQGS